MEALGGGLFLMSDVPLCRFMPWQTKQQRESTGSGFIVEGRRILTNAHCVADQVCTGIGAFPSDLTPFLGAGVPSWN